MFKPSGTVVLVWRDHDVWIIHRATLGRVHIAYEEDESGKNTGTLIWTYRDADPNDTWETKMPFEATERIFSSIVYESGDVVWHETDAGWERR